MRSEEYLTIDEVAARLKVSRKTIKNKMSSGIFRRGVHYFSPRGLRPRFKLSAVQAWLEEKDRPRQEKEELIPMARGYFLGKPTCRKADFGSARSARAFSRAFSLRQRLDLIGERISPPGQTPPPLLP